MSNIRLHKRTKFFLSFCHVLFSTHTRKKTISSLIRALFIFSFFCILLFIYLFFTYFCVLLYFCASAFLRRSVVRISFCLKLSTDTLSSNWIIYIVAYPMNNSTEESYSIHGQNGVDIFLVHSFTMNWMFCVPKKLPCSSSSSSLWPFSSSICFAIRVGIANITNGRQQIHSDFLGISTTERLTDIAFSSQGYTLLLKMDENSIKSTTNLRIRLSFACSPHTAARMKTYDTNFGSVGFNVFDKHFRNCCIWGEPSM